MTLKRILIVIGTLVAVAALCVFMFIFGSNVALDGIYLSRDKVSALSFEEEGSPVLIMNEEHDQTGVACSPGYRLFLYDSPENGGGTAIYGCTPNEAPKKEAPLEATPQDFKI